MNHKDYTSIMKRLVALFPQREITDATLAAYWDFLRDIDPAVFRAAAQRCARDCDWFPTVHQLRSAAELISAAAHGIKPPQSAWLHVLTVAAGWTEGTSVRDRFDDPTWASLQQIGGIRTVALTDSGAGLSRLENQFIAGYQPRYREMAAETVRTSLPDGDDVTALAASNGARR